MNKFTEFNEDLRSFRLIHPRLHEPTVGRVYLALDRNCWFCGKAPNRDVSGNSLMRILDFETSDDSYIVPTLRIVPVCENCHFVCSKIIEFQKKRDEARNEK